MDDPSKTTSPPTLRRRLILGLLLFVVWVAVALLFISSRDPSPAAPRNLASPVSHLIHDVLGAERALLSDPRFRVTSNQLPAYLRMLKSGMSAAELMKHEMLWKLRKPDPEKHTFDAGPVFPCSIHGLLGQCTEMTGVRFVILKEVSAGSVQFGSPVPLNGIEWAKAFTQTLRTNTPQWWDERIRAMRHENLVLLTRDGKNVLVIPPGMAQEFRDQGYQDFEWNFEK